ncbi:hypothetical protein Lser_V15G06194 [Lactuca serriola]
MVSGQKMNFQTTLTSPTNLQSFLRRYMIFLANFIFIFI